MLRAFSQIVRASNMKWITARKVLVVALGNPDRGDDGVGPLVARKLAALLPSDISLLSLGSNVPALVAEWANFEAAICIDAAAPLSAPGRIHRFDLAHTDLPRCGSSASSHGLGLADVLALARTLRQAPPQVIVYAIEGLCFAVGAPMTPEVAAAATEVVPQIVAEIERLRHASNEIAADA
jgi:hydrogenase maturation protease